MKFELKNILVIIVFLVFLFSKYEINAARGGYSRGRTGSSMRRSGSFSRASHHQPRSSHKPVMSTNRSRTIRDTFGTTPRGGKSGRAQSGQRIVDTFGTTSKGKRNDGQRIVDRFGTGKNQRIVDTFGTDRIPRDGGFRRGGRDGSAWGTGLGWAAAGLTGAGIATLLGNRALSQAVPSEEVATTSFEDLEQPIYADVGMPSTESTTSTTSQITVTEDDLKKMQEQMRRMTIEMDKLRQAQREREEKEEFEAAPLDIAKNIGFEGLLSGPNFPKVDANRKFSHVMDVIVKEDPDTIDALKKLLQNSQFNKEFTKTLNDPNSLNKLTSDLHHSSFRNMLKNAAGMNK